MQNATSTVDALQPGGTAYDGRRTQVRPPSSRTSRSLKTLRSSSNLRCVSGLVVRGSAALEADLLREALAGFRVMTASSARVLSVIDCRSTITGGCMLCPRRALRSTGSMGSPE
jgi:hypothetical protein